MEGASHKAIRSGTQAAMTCGVCQEVYQVGTRDPLMLPCGHTFCRPCINALVNTLMQAVEECLNLDSEEEYLDSHFSYGRNRKMDFSCPTCRMDHYLAIKELSVNYSLLNLTNEHTENEVCDDHGDDLKYWCCGCELPLCALCLNAGQHSGHNVQLAKVFLQEKREALKSKTKVILDTSIDFLNKKFENHILRVRSSYEELVDEVSKYSKMVQKVSELHKSPSTSIKLAESKLEEFKLMMHGLAGNEVTLAEESMSKGMITNNITGQDKHQQQQSPESTEAESVNQESINNKGNNPVTKSPQDSTGGRLLLHCLGLSSESFLPILKQMVCEVFLEVSAGGQCLGQIIIRLQSRQRQAHQFMVHCLGVMGQSFLKAKGAKVHKKGENGECLMINTKHRNTQDSAHHNEEQSPAKPLRKGFVFPLNKSTLYKLDRALTNYRCSDTAKSNVSFMICTKEDPKKMLEGSFGEVVSGMEVVSAAANHDPVSEVTITNCGLVLPRF